jgi:hypothetical protein
MPTERRFTTPLAALASTVLAMFFLTACQQSQAPASAPSSAESKAATAEKVFVVFEGPWALVPDPKDSNSVLALAPKTKSHRSLAVAPANTALEAGVYDLAIPDHGAPAAVNLDATFFRASVDAKSVQRALDSKLDRYAIRLPKPEAYLAGSRHRSRVGGAYPPEASTEQNYVTSVSLRYSVSSMSGFSLAGTKDVGGAFNPLLLQLDTPVVRFVIDPIQDFSGDACSTHSREAFRDLVHLLGLSLYVDFPESPADCHKKDPQVPAKAQVRRGFPTDQIALFDSEDFVSPQAAGFGEAIIADYLGPLTEKAVRRLLPATYFFHSDGGACMAPIVFGI